MGILRAIRFAARSHLRAPGPALALILTVALGVGGNAALFSFIGGFSARTLQTTDAEAVIAFGRTALLLAVASGLVLVLACASAAGLLLARSTARVRDIALRVAIGADRRHVAMLQIADVVVVLVVGGALGLLAAWWVATGLPLLFFAEDAEQLAMQPSLAWFGWSSAASLVTLLVAGLLPLALASQKDPFLVLRREGPGLSPSLVRWRARLVTAQAAGCALLVMLAGVIRADFDRSLRSPRGAAIANLTVLKVRMSPDAYAHEDVGRGYLQNVEKAVRASVEVADAVWMSTLPGARSAPVEFRVEDAMLRTREIRMDAWTLDPDALPPAVIRPVKGRGFTGRDGPGGCRTAILNQTAADRYFKGDAVGAAIEDPGGQVIQIIGVLADHSLFGSRPIIFFHANQVVLPAPQVDQAYFAVPLDTAWRSTSLGMVGASPSYFDLMADPIAQGRGFESRDTATACQVAVISEAGARAIGGTRAVGATLIDHRGTRIEIVGVAGAARLGVSQRPGAPWLLRPEAQLYSPPVMSFVVHTGPAIGVGSRLNAAVDAVDGGTLISPAMSLREHLLMSALAPERIASMLMAVCAALAVVLSIAGIHGAMSDFVDRRRRELAVRLAMGARAPHLVGSIVKQGVRLALRGTIIGLALAGLAIPILGVAIGPATLPAATAVVAALLVMFVMVAISCAVPAWRAIAIDPKALLQSE